MSGLLKHSICVGLVAFGMTYLVGLAAQEDAVTEFKKKLSDDAVKPESEETEEEETEETDLAEVEKEDSSESSDDDLF